MQSASATNSEIKISEVKSSAVAVAQQPDREYNVPLQVLEVIKRLKKLDKLIEDKEHSKAERLGKVILTSLEYGIPLVDQLFKKNVIGQQCIEAFKRNKLDQNVRKNLLEFLKKYSRVILYCYDPSNELLQPQNGTHWFTGLGGKISNLLGALSGETRSVITGIFSFIANHFVGVAQKLVELSSGFQTFTLFLSRLPAWSYYFYGASALCYGIRAFVGVWNGNTPNERGLTMPHRYRFSGWLSAGANAAVFVLYGVVGLILAGSIATPAGWTMGIAMLIATVGTVIAWLGNECITAYRAAKEHQEAGALQADFPERAGELITAEHAKEAEFKKADRHKFLGTFMAIGMALMAIACFAPVVPLLSAPIIAAFPSISLSAVISTLSLASMITYASDGIAYALAGIQSVAKAAWNKLVSCCCKAKDDATAAGPSKQPKDDKQPLASSKQHKHSRSDNDASLKRRNSGGSSHKLLGDTLGRPSSKTILTPALLKPSDFKRASTPKLTGLPLPVATAPVVPASASKERRRSFSN